MRRKRIADLLGTASQTVNLVLLHLGSLCPAFHPLGGCGSIPRTRWAHRTVVRFGLLARAPVMTCQSPDARAPHVWVSSLGRSAVGTYTGFATSFVVEAPNLPAPHIARDDEYAEHFRLLIAESAPLRLRWAS